MRITDIKFPRKRTSQYFSKLKKNLPKMRLRVSDHTISNCPERLLTKANINSQLKTDRNSSDLGSTIIRLGGWNLRKRPIGDKRLFIFKT